MKKSNQAEIEKMGIEEMAKMFASKLPNSTNFNNKKSRKYFSSVKDESNNFNCMTLKDSLLHKIDSKILNHGIENLKDSISSNGLSKMEIGIPTTNASGKKYTAHRKNSSNILVVSKEILKYAERSTPKVFYKIPAKHMEDEDVLVESDDEGTSENVRISEKKDKTLNKVENDDDFKDLAKKVDEQFHCTDFNNEKKDNTIEINFDALIKLENLYSIIIKELEIKQNNQNFYDNLVLKYFNLVNEYFGSIYLLEKFNLIDNSLKISLKQFFVLEILIFALSYKRGVDGSDSETINLYTSFKTSFYYLNRNVIILLFLCYEILKNNVTYQYSNKLNEIGDTIELCKLKIDQNKNWLSKTTFKKFFKNNNKIVCGVLKDILKHIKSQGGINRGNSNESNIYVIRNHLKNITKLKTCEIRDNIFNHFIGEKVSEKINENSVVNEMGNCNFKRENEEEFLEDDDKRDESSNVDNTSVTEIEDNMITEPSVPFLPQQSHYDRIYTLVLDLDETLVHYVEDEDSAYIQIRPGAENFLEELSVFFEIVIFTAAMQDYADFVLDELDKNKRISYRLYRQHTINTNNYYIKDLSKIGRRLSKTIIIDNIAENYQLQKDNGLHIKNFEGDENDRELSELTEDLKNIVRIQIDDVRDALPIIRENMSKRYFLDSQQSGFSFFDQTLNGNTLFEGKHLSD